MASKNIRKREMAPKNRMQAAGLKGTGAAQGREGRGGV
jgi:hypothetical protein